MGYENLAAYVSQDGWNVMGKYEYPNGSLALEFTKDPRDTQMYGWLGDEAFLFEDHQMTYNAHTWGIDPKRFETDPDLKEMFEVTAISHMPEPDGRPFVASIESHKYPFFGTQYHPEKTTQAYNDDIGVDHSWLSVKLNRHLADYFVYLARHNTNNAGTYSEVQKASVDNNDVIVTDLYGGTVYVFK